MDRDQFDRDIEQQLIRHEGIRLKPYTCPAGKITIGVGRNLEDNGISKFEAMLMLRNDIVQVRFALAKVLPCFSRLSPNRKMAMVDMCFNLGLPTFLKFKDMITALEADNFELAAKEMLDSRWAKQVGPRATTLAAMMREG
ncbi:MAG: lysozyme [Desulfobulbaceae bacterium]|nr:lysozyme [Desulfobulbaceae bacterium]